MGATLSLAEPNKAQVGWEGWYKPSCCPFGAGFLLLLCHQAPLGARGAMDTGQGDRSAPPARPLPRKGENRRCSVNAGPREVQ